MADILFVHNNYPAQLGFVAESLAAAGHRCIAIGSQTARAGPRVPVYTWTAKRNQAANVYPLAARAEADIIRARAAAACALKMKEQGFSPDLIIGHPGWGETMFLSEIFPAARQIGYAEFYYHGTNSDLDFDPEFGPVPIDERFRAHAKNATLGFCYFMAETLVSPTPFQASTLPDVLRARTEIIHEGVDVDRIAPRPNGGFQLSDGRVLDASTPVVTFVNRSFEPMRGFHVFMRALPKILADLPDAHVLLIGDDNPKVYGIRPKQGGSWKEVMLAEVGDQLDEDRFHFTGRLGYPAFIDALSISRAHVYLTYPFVLSWSLLEAMALERTIIASDTAPVRDVISPGVNGVMVDFFDVDALAEAVVEACRRPDAHAALGKAARQTVLGGYDRRRQCLPKWQELVNRHLPAERRIAAMAASPGG
jgi:glycosyltransferase involved in cell wall biosynthesis